MIKKEKILVIVRDNPDQNQR